LIDTVGEHDGTDVPPAEDNVQPQEICTEATCGVERGLAPQAPIRWGRLLRLSHHELGGTVEFA
jgi:hypothetical protein